MQISIAICMIFLAGGTVHARQIEDWPEAKLLERADLVIIAKVASVRDAGRTVKDGPPRAYLEGLLTTLDIECVIKGQCKKKQIVVFHHRLKEGTRIDNGPTLMRLHDKSASIKFNGGTMLILKPDYLLFLKKRPDGRYEAVSGQFDAGLSVRQLIDPIP
jgi:hypothetical protein